MHKWRNEYISLQARTKKFQLHIDDCNLLCSNLYPFYFISLSEFRVVAVTAQSYTPVCRGVGAGRASLEGSEWRVLCAPNSIHGCRHESRM